MAANQLVPVLIQHTGTVHNCPQIPSLDDIVMELNMYVLAIQLAKRDAPPNINIMTNNSRLIV